MRMLRDRLPLLAVTLCAPFALYYSTFTFWNQSQSDRRTSQTLGLTSTLRGITTDDSHPCVGNEKLLEIVSSSGLIVDRTTRDLMCTTMPSWTEVTRLYGDKPRIIGLETCAAYREKIRKANAYPMPRVAGLQNCGTTAFAETLHANLPREQDPTIHVDYQRAYNVPWRKHTPWKYRYNITSTKYQWQEDKDLVFPIVIVREPYRWMQSKSTPMHVHHV